MMSACVRLGRPTIIVRIEKHYYCSDNYHNCRIGKINSLGGSGQHISNNAHLMEESTAPMNPMMEYCILFLDPLRIVWLHGAWQTPCPMPTKCPGETAFRTSQSTLALLFLTRFSSCKYLKNQKKSLAGLQRDQDNRSNYFVTDNALQCTIQRPRIMRS